MTDIFEVQDDVTRRIVDTLKVMLSPVENARMIDSGTTNIEAYDCCLRGRKFLRGGAKNRDTFEQSTASFTRQSNSIPAMQRPKRVSAFLSRQNRWRDDPDSSLALSKRYAEQAIEKNPKEPLGRVVAAMVVTRYGDFDLATSEIQTALSLNPNYALACAVLGAIHSYSGRPLEAIPMIERAMRPDPSKVGNISVS